MRVIGGRFKGRVLEGPPTSGVRPTSDRLRETLFNILDVSSEGFRVLDGFAGTGALGLEALSRGATHVTFVERDRRAGGVIRSNVRRCQAEDACIIVTDDFIGVGARRGFDGCFNLVLVDPPYDMPDIVPVLTEAAALVCDGGLVVLEHSHRTGSPESVPGLGRRRTVRAGDSELSFYAVEK
jgi:16S rRNA (guanine(966)-N(2))-methyltransferase RsmD